MTLRGAFKTDVAAVRDGRWFDFPEHPNKDGSVPGFKLARLSVSNPRYAKALKQVRESIGDKQTTDEQDEAKAVELFVDTILLDWRHFEPELDGTELPYTRDNAIAILSDPAWYDLKLELRLKSAQQNGFAAEKVETTAKNW